jgi:hypothetical protein
MDDRNEVGWDEDPDDLETEDTSGAFAWEELLEEGAEVPPEFENPSGVSRGECDDEPGADPSCDVEVTALSEDQVLEESMPGIGIEGFEGEEVGGG